jgi:ATP-dependent Clp protease adaptor protein ClpS
MSDAPMEEKKEQAGEAVIAVEESPPEKQTERRHTTKDKKKPQKQPNYHVIIWNDEEHTYEYVIELLMKLFAHSFETAFQITHEVDHVGKGIAYTCHLELAELKRDQVLAYGADWRMPKVSKSSIRATIEEAPE